MQNAILFKILFLLVSFDNYELFKAAAVDNAVCRELWTDYEHITFYLEEDILEDGVDDVVGFCAVFVFFLASVLVDAKINPPRNPAEGNVKLSM